MPREYVPKHVKEMYELTNQRIEAAPIERLNAAYSYAQNMVHNAAYQGKFEIAFNMNYEEEIIDKVVEHFKDLGYTAYTNPMYTVIISWEKVY